MTTDDIQSAIDAGVALAKPSAVGPSGRFYSVTIPAGGNHALIDLEAAAEKLRETPRRKIGQYSAYDAGSFIAYLKKHGNESTEVWADITTQSVVAVINAHGDVEGDPGWGDHKLKLVLSKTPGWTAWTKLNRAPLNQTEFAEHLEDRRLDVIEPTAGELTELARNFKATKNVTFDSSKHQSNGAISIGYHEVIEQKAGTKGDMEIPERFELALQPFEGSTRYKVTARLRTDISSNQLVLSYVLDRPEEILREAFDNTLKEIDAGIDAPVFQGLTSA